MEDFQLSEHISFYQATNSREHPELIAWNRYLCTLDYISRMKRLANENLEHIFKMAEILFNKPVHPLILSFFRCRELNAAVGGGSSSQHPLGHACDFTILDVSGNPIDIKQLFVNYTKNPPNGVQWHQTYLDLRKHFIHFGGATGINDGQWWITLPNGQQTKEIT